MKTPIEAITTLYATLAKAHAGTDAGLAYDLVRDLLDMCMIPVEEILPVIIVRRSLAEVIRDAADVCRDCDGCGEDVELEADLLADRMVAAAKVFETLGDVAPACAA